MTDIIKDFIDELYNLVVRKDCASNIKINNFCQGHIQI